MKVKRLFILIIFLLVLSGCKEEEHLLAPEITINGDSFISLEYGSQYEDLGALCTDDIDLECNVITSGEVDINMLRDL